MTTQAKGRLRAAHATRAVTVPEESEEIGLMVARYVASVTAFGVPDAPRNWQIHVRIRVVNAWSHLPRAGSGDT